jgi:hypothetical protein
MQKLIPVFQFTSQFSLIRAASSRKPTVVSGASSRKLIFILRIFDLRAVLEERIKLVNRGITVEAYRDIKESNLAVTWSNMFQLTFTVSYRTKSSVQLHNCQTIFQLQ